MRWVQHWFDILPLPLLPLLHLSLLYLHPYLSLLLSPSLQFPSLHPDVPLCCWFVHFFSHFQTFSRMIQNLMTSSMHAETGGGQWGEHFHLLSLPQRWKWYVVYDTRMLYPAMILARLIHISHTQMVPLIKKCVDNLVSVIEAKADSQETFDVLQWVASPLHNKV